MARTVSGFPGANAAALPAVADDVPPSAPSRPLSAAGPGKMEERGIGTLKSLIPCGLSGDNSPQERSIVFYAANAILERNAAAANSTSASVAW